ncbi:hypothetical protein ACVW1C_008093 [Bradyrhizobium sp. USDA 4011]
MWILTGATAGAALGVAYVLVRTSGMYKQSARQIRVIAVLLGAFGAAVGAACGEIIAVIAS